jgi:cellulose synthase/poly-beta-1,6-N-acetylglucosamine synthase-like glycosyltransferase
MSMEWSVLLTYIVEFLVLYSTIFYILLFLTTRDRLLKDPKPKKFPRVSVLIPAYNEEKNIGKSISAALALNYPDFEVIVVDDGSTDDTLKEAKKYAKKGKVIVLTKKNGGKASALNHGLKKASGELVATLDADSFPEKDSLRHVVGYFNDAKVMAVTSNVKVLNARGGLQSLQRLEYIGIAFARKILSFLNGIPVTPGPLSVFRKKVFDELGGFDEKNITEDIEIALRIQNANYQIASSLNSVVYTVVPSNLSSYFKQRIRWGVGGIRNYLHYWRMLGTRYGDFGLFTMSFGLLSPILAILMFFLFFYNLFIAVGALKQMLSYDLGLAVIPLNSTQIIAFFMVPASLLFVYLNAKYAKESRVFFAGVFYVLIYWLLFSITYVYVFLVQLLGIKTGWEKR